VATPDNFGRSGARPTHPELLDWLATEFVRGGWRFKPLHKLMMSSVVYRQAAARVPTAGLTGPDPELIDPANRLLWRMRLRRAESEVLSLRKPSAERLRGFLAAQSKLDFTYPAVGATAAVPPAGYVVDRTRVKLGEGAGVFAAAKAALRRWEDSEWGVTPLAKPKRRPSQELLGVIAAFPNRYAAGVGRPARTATPGRFGIRSLHRRAEPREGSNGGVGRGTSRPNGINGNR
jgi:hypothetical protein